MDINDLRSLATVLAFASFLGVCWWAYGSKRKARFEEAGNLPFADDVAPTSPPACPAHASEGDNAR